MQAKITYRLNKGLQPKNDKPQKIYFRFRMGRTLDFNGSIGFSVFPKFWDLNAQKNIIGTLFGLIYKTGAIQGTQTDVINALCAMFPNLKAQSIQNNFTLKIKDNGKQYDTATELNLVDFLDYLKTKVNKTPPKR